MEQGPKTGVRLPERGGTRAAVLVLILSVLALAVGSSWIFRGGETAESSAPSQAVPTVVSQTPSATPTPTPTPSPTPSPSAIRSRAAMADPSFTPTPTQSAPAKKPKPGAKPIAENQPTALLLGSINVPVIDVGVAKDGQMELPKSPSEIGWYRFGPVPGATEGSAVLAGHVDSKEEGAGPLKNLKKVRSGTEFTVETSSGPRQFRVEKTETIKRQTVALEEVFTRTGKPRLRILTCGGAYLPNNGGYQENVIVTAVRI